MTASGGAWALPAYNQGFGVGATGRVDVQALAAESLDPPAYIRGAKAGLAALARARSEFTTTASDQVVARSLVKSKREARKRVQALVAKVKGEAKSDPEVGASTLKHLLFMAIEEVAGREDTPLKTKLLCKDALKAKRIEWGY